MSIRSRLSEGADSPDHVAREIAGEGKRSGCVRNIGLMFLAAFIWLGINTVSVPSASTPLPTVAAAVTLTVSPARTPQPGN